VIQQWLAGLRLSASSGEGVFVTLSQILTAAVDGGKIGKNPCQAKSVRRLHPVARKVVPRTAAEVTAVRAERPARYRVGLMRSVTTTPACCWLVLPASLALTSGRWRLRRPLARVRSATARKVVCRGSPAR
jgi:hypothetical protein